VRKGDHALKAKMDDVIAHSQPEIDALLRSYGMVLARAASFDAQPLQASALTNERGRR
jgi:hypothetical protein